MSRRANEKNVSLQANQSINNVIVALQLMDKQWKSTSVKDIQINNTPDDLH